MTFPSVNEKGECAACGKLRVVGDFPKCPHAMVTEGYTAEYFPDEIPGGLVVENGVPHPTTVYSHTELRALRAKHGYLVKEKWCPMPGTDVDPAGVQDYRKYRDAKTLANGAALLLRQEKVEDPDLDLDKLFRPNDTMPFATPGGLLVATGDFEEYDCYICRGRGRVTVTSAGVEIEQQDCPICGGEGRLLRSKSHGKSGT